RHSIGERPREHRGRAAPGRSSDAPVARPGARRACRPVARAKSDRYTPCASLRAQYERPTPRGPTVSHVSELRLRDPAASGPRSKLFSGESLTQEDGVRLFDAPVLELGRLADAVARDRHADRVYFTVNRQLNPTNVCVLACKFCDYAKKPGAPGAYTMTKEQILAHVDPEI